MYANIVDVKELVNKVLDSYAFRHWNKKDNYLVSCFSLNDEWDVNFYSKNSRKMTSFSIRKIIEIKNEDKVFHKGVNHPEKLDIRKVKISLGDALSKVNDIKEKEASEEKISNGIIILQQIGMPMWNITYTTSGFNILNVKINASTGEVMDESFSNIFSLKKNLC